MRRRVFWAPVGGIVLAATGVATARAQQSQAADHKIAFHVGSADPVMMGVALHNIAAAAEYYAARGQTVAIELVANGPGYTMLRADTSPVKAEVAATKKKYPFVVFSACQNSRRGAAVAEHKSAQDIPELPEATDVEAGVVRLSELQDQHYSYIRV
jgi:intracellular sulfur oxidation DsrE/DsrF family protein